MSFPFDSGRVSSLLVSLSSVQRLAKRVYLVVVVVVVVAITAAAVVVIANVLVTTISSIESSKISRMLVDIFDQLEERRCRG